MSADRQPKRTKPDTSKKHAAPLLDTLHLRQAPRTSRLPACSPILAQTLPAPKYSLNSHSGDPWSSSPGSVTCLVCEPSTPGTTFPLSCSRTFALTDARCTSQHGQVRRKSRRHILCWTSWKSFLARKHFDKFLPNLPRPESAARLAPYICTQCA